MATFFVMQGRDKGKRFDLRSPSLTIGRDGSNRIQLNDSEVSRRHAEIRRGPEGLQLIDLGSSNGTFVNTERTAERLLHNGDRVQIGRTLLLFTDADDRSSASLHHDIDIVGREQSEGSRIVKSVAHDSVPGWPGPAATCRSCTARRWPSATRWTSTSCCSGSWS
jgi:two-component system, NtrC family, sensor kinase